jgi:hypothetical protein
LFGPGSVRPTRVLNHFLGAIHGASLCLLAPLLNLIATAFWSGEHTSVLLLWSPHEGATLSTQRIAWSGFPFTMEGG